MNTAVGLNDITHFSDLQGEGGLFEWLLHLSRTEGAEIPVIASRAAVREFFCEVGEFLGGSVDLSLVTFEDLNSFGLGTGYFGLGWRSWSMKGQGIENKNGPLSNWKDSCSRSVSPRGGLP